MARALLSSLDPRDPKPAGDPFDSSLFLQLVLQCREKAPGSRSNVLTGVSSPASPDIRFDLRATESNAELRL